MKCARCPYMLSGQTFDSYTPRIARLCPKLYKIKGIQVTARSKSNINQRF